MQNPYAVERFIHQHDAHARAEAELLALRRQAMAAHRREVVHGWLGRLHGLLARLTANAGDAARTPQTSAPADIPLAEARR